jgi:glycosyltransferase involved in cell wall biosynthesis
MHALAIFRTRMGFEMPCILTGHDYGHWSNIEEMRAALRLDAVYYLGRVDFAELLWLYKHCDAVLALGLHESSSLPVREGASFGKPLICADILPNVESAEYLHINLFQQDSPEALADKLVALCQNQADIQRLATMNAGLVSSLSWTVIAPAYINRLTSKNTGQSLVDRT